MLAPSIPGTGRRRRTVGAALLLLPGLALAACGSDPGPEPSPTSAQPTYADPETTAAAKSACWDILELRASNSTGGLKHKLVSMEITGPFELSHYVMERRGEFWSAPGTYVTESPSGQRSTFNWHCRFTPTEGGGPHQAEWRRTP